MVEMLQPSGITAARRHPYVDLRVSDVCDFVNYHGSGELGRSVSSGCPRELPLLHEPCARVVIAQEIAIWLNSESKSVHIGNCERL